MKKIIITAVCILFIAAILGAADYVGVKKCRICHKGVKKGEVYEKWEKGPHAHAMDTLRKEGEDKNPECIQCHVVGFNKGGYKIGAPNAAKFENVQCENCHGPGSDYKKMSVMKDRQKAVAAGMIVPDEKVCKTCHNEKSPKYQPFDFKTYWAKISHKYR